jgi:hypothetical protein
VVRRLLVAVVALLTLGRGAAAQSGNPAEGGPEFILPVGARSLGLGQAVVASAVGTEAIWWNPALIARSKKEALLSSVSGTPPAESDLSAAFLYGIPQVMSVALSVRYLNYGTGEATVDPSGTTGSFVNAAYLVGATFAAPFGNRFAIGTTLKVLAIDFECTGTCPNQPQNYPVTGAIDLGVQYIVTKDSLLILGAAVRNLGPPLQFNDSPQSDPLPGRIDVGVEIVPRLSQYPGLGLRVSGSVVSRVAENSGSPGVRAGAEASWLNQYFGRVGYVHSGPTGQGPSIGGGIARGRWHVDFAQFLSDNSSAVGVRPTYFSLRYVF